MLRSALLLTGLLRTAGRVSADSNAPFLWEVKGAQATHYLMGSVHLLPAAAEELPDGIADAYDAADGLVFESDIGALTSPKSGLALLSAARAPRGLKAEIDAPTYARLQTRMSKLSMPAPLCEQYKPWFCALTLEVFAYQKAGFSGDHGLDRQLYNLAKADGKHVGWFESPVMHLGLFMGMDETLGRQLLTAALAEDGAGGDEPAAMFRAWRDNDTKKIETLVLEMKARYPLLYARLLADRNRAWSAKLKQLLNGAEPQLVIVGAAHLLGPDGLLVQLRAGGYKVRPYVASTPELITQTRPGPAMIMATAVAGTHPVGR
ncbi:MAG: hypothetical protein NVS9B10_20260 [Nevskia sp.]